MNTEREVKTEKMEPERSAQAEAYIKAREELTLLNYEEISTEQDCINKSGVVNSDGNVPDRLVDIEDDAVFDSLNKEVADIGAKTQLTKRIIAALRKKIQAENDLVELGFSAIPESIHNATLELYNRNDRAKELLLKEFIKMDPSLTQLSEAQKEAIWAKTMSKTSEAQ